MSLTSREFLDRLVTQTWKHLDSFLEELSDRADKDAQVLARISELVGHRAPASSAPAPARLSVQRALYAGPVRGVCARLVGALMADHETVEVSPTTILAAAKELDPSLIARETGFSGADLDVVVSQVSLALRDVVKREVKVDVGSRTVSLVAASGKPLPDPHPPRPRPITAGSSDGQ